MHLGEFYVLKEMAYKLQMNTWYMIWVETRSSEYTVKIAQERDPRVERVDYDMMDTIFESEDHVFKSGDVGLFTNGTKSAFFDHLYV